MSDVIFAVIVLPTLVGLFLIWYFWPRKKVRNVPDRIAFEEILYQINRNIHGAMDEIGICPELKTEEDSLECFKALQKRLADVIESDPRLLLETKKSLSSYLAKVINQQRDRKALQERIPAASV